MPGAPTRRSTSFPSTGADATLNLVSVHRLYALDDPSHARRPYDPAEDAECRAQEQEYLDDTVQRLAATRCVAMRTAVVDGLTVDGLLQWQRDHPADLIVMTTHGRGPVSRAFLGSVADELIRRAPAPLLLVRPHALPPDEPLAPILTHVLIPLDGSPLAEQVLPPALQLARLLEARSTLLQVIESGGPATVHTSCMPCAPAEAGAMAYWSPSPARPALRVYGSIPASRPDATPLKVLSNNHKDLQDVSSRSQRTAAAACDECCSGASPTR